MKVSTSVFENEQTMSSESTVTKFPMTEVSTMTNPVPVDSTVAGASSATGRVSYVTTKTDTDTSLQTVTFPDSTQTMLSEETTIKYTTLSTSALPFTTAALLQNPIQASFTKSGYYVTVRDQQLLIFTSLTDPPQIVPSTNPFYIQLMAIQSSQGPFDATVSDTINGNAVIRIYIGKMCLNTRCSTMIIKKCFIYCIQVTKCE